MSRERKKHDVANDTEAIKAVLNLLKTQIDEKNQHLIGLIDSSILKMDNIKEQLLNK